MALFLVLTFLWAWILWVPALLWLRSQGRLGAESDDEPLAGLPIWVGASWFLAASAPSLVALGLRFGDGGWASVAAELRRLVEWDVGWSWNVVAWAGPLVVGLVAVLALVAFRGARVRFQAGRLPLMAVALVAALPFGPLGEELGWRGYLLDGLLQERGAVVSALIVGFVWTLWHLPVFWAPLGTSISGRAVTIPRVARFLIEVTAVSVIMTWLFVETAGSLWIAVAFHAAWNAEIHRFAFEPFSDELTERVAGAVVALMVVAALVLVAWPGLAWRAA